MAMRLNVRSTICPAGAVIVVTQEPDCARVPPDVGEGSMMVPLEFVNVPPAHTLDMDALNDHVACQLGDKTVDCVVKLWQGAGDINV